MGDGYSATQISTRALMPSPSQLARSASVSPFDLNLRHLRGLVELGQRGSISSAARALGLSQPALTQGLVKLEAQLGQLLFERLHNGVRLTDAGRVLVERTVAAFSRLTTSGRQLVGGDFQPDRRLTMTQIRALLAVTRDGSFARAAERTACSESSVSRAVNGLEASLEKPLLERRGRVMQVTFAGRRFARGCRLALKEWHSAFFELGIEHLAAKIAVGTTPLARAYLVPEALASISSAGQTAGFQVLEGSWADLVEDLRDGVVDLIVGELPAHESPDLVKVALRREPLVIVGGEHHPLAGATKVTLDQLRSFPWIVGPEDSPIRLEWQRMFLRGGLPSAPVECGSVMIIGRLLTSSEMLALATPDQVALQIRSGLLARVGAPLDAHQYMMGITLRQGWRPTHAQREFLDRLQAVADSDLQDTKGGIAKRWNR